ncbi:conserved Plasmodium protein, unknown function [Plasmodium chabaudi chabaudi]|uniref:Protein GPR89 n=1 Tax=Plasmodium chabaudi chabaudi TaxID=31271 RepID=A0A1C6XF03_PLACU|nr:conserved Plasmodium protein, unknown function [Plasmodium chabaudi chabaudi]
MIDITVIFLFIYHLVLLILGIVFFENYLFKDFDNSFSLVKIIFCFSFVLCLSLLSMIMFEILGFITTSLKLFIWYIDITFLVLFIYLIIPISLIYTYVTYEDEKISNSLFKFKYFYSALKKMKNNKKINNNDEDKNDFMRRLVYVSEDIINKMNNYNYQIKNRNKKKLFKIIIGCIIMLPLIWFAFYKISMVTFKSNSDVYDRYDIYNIDTILKEKLNIINKEFADEYDTNNDKNKNIFFIKIMKNLLIYISVTGMTIVSALSAFTSLYSPYTNISNFFFFVTLKKVKAIEKKIIFIKDELASKKKLLLLYQYPHLLNDYIKNKNKNNSISNYNANNIYNIRTNLAHPNDLNSYSNFGDLTYQYPNISNADNIIPYKEKGNELLNGSTDMAYFQNNNRIDNIDINKYYNNNNNQNEYKKIDSDIEYIGSKPFKKCNLYLGTHKSIYKDMHDTFMKKENEFYNIFNQNFIYNNNTKESEVINNEDEEIEQNATINFYDEVSIDKQINFKSFDGGSGKFLDKNMSGNNLLYKRNVKSSNYMDDNVNINYSSNFNYSPSNESYRYDEMDGGREIIRYNSYCGVSPKDENSEHNNGIDLDSDDKNKKKKNFFYNMYSFKNVLIKNEDVLPYTNKQKEELYVNKKYISNLLVNSLQKPYRTLKSVKDFFTHNLIRNKNRQSFENVNKRSKEVLVQDIKTLEFMSKKLYFLLDEVVKEQIRINKSTTFSGMILYLLGIIMSILCFYKIIKTCYIIYMVEFHYKFIYTYSSGHALMLFYSKNMDFSFINDLKSVLNIVHININLDNYVVSITSILLLCFIFTNLKTFMEKIIKLRYSTKSSLYSNLAILLMCELMGLYFSAYCIQLFDYLPVKEKIKMIYIFFNNNILNLFKLKYHFDFVYVVSLFISLLLIKVHHKHRSNSFSEL